MILGVAAVVALVVGLKVSAMITKATLLVVCAGLVIGAVFAYRHWDSVRDLPNRAAPVSTVSQLG
ncbi:MAG TPA: hypothetical protein VHX59_27155 [Mycobacteriales bacterium]|nr:hypothetical protein [Mycobacteriales bacterium]